MRYNPTRYNTILPVLTSELWRGLESALAYCKLQKTTRNWGRDVVSNLPPRSVQLVGKKSKLVWGFFFEGSPEHSLRADPALQCGTAFRSASWLQVTNTRNIMIAHVKPGIKQRLRFVWVFCRLQNRVFQKNKSISDHVAFLVCFGSIISKTSPKDMDHFDQNWVTAATF